MVDSQTFLGCNYCGRANFSSRRALNQHQSHGFCARAQARSNDGNNTPESPMSLANKEVETDQMLANAPPLPHILILKALQKPSGDLLEMQGIQAHDFDDVTHQMDGFLDQEEGYESPESEPEQTDYVKWARDLGLAPPTRESDAESGANESDSEQASVVIGAKAPNRRVPIPLFVTNFKNIVRMRSEKIFVTNFKNIVRMRSKFL
jgi:hypothetical protein